MVGEPEQSGARRKIDLLGIELEIGRYPIVDDTLMLMLSITSTLVEEMDNEQVGRAAARIRAMAEGEPEDVRRLLEQMASNLDQFVSDRREEAAGF